MGKKKKMEDFCLPMIGWGWNPGDQKDQWKEFKANMEKLWDQYEEAQKATREAWKEQWEKTFAQFMEMQKTVAETLPDEKPAMPGMPAAPVSPKEIAEKMVQLQEKANASAMEQDATLYDMRVKGRKQVKEIVKGAVDSVEASLSEQAAAAAKEKEEK